MPSARESLIETIVQCFGDNMERKLAARQWLERDLAIGNDEALTAAKDRLEEIGDGRRRGKRQTVLLITLAVVGLLLWLPFYLVIKGPADAYEAIGEGPPYWPKFQHRIPEHLSPNQELFFNDNDVSKKLDLWNSDPTNPGYFLEYSVEFAETHKSLPPDYFEIAGRIDPQNACFDFFGAAILAEQSFLKLAPTRKEPAGVNIRVIRDPVKFAEAMTHFSRGCEKTRYQTYADSMFRERAKLLPQGTIREYTNSLVLMLVSHRMIIGLVELRDLIDVQSALLAGENNVDGFRELVWDERRMVNLMIGSPDLTPYLDFITRNLHFRAMRAFSKSAMVMALPEVNDFTAEVERLNRRQEAINRKRPPYDRSSLRELIDKKGGIVAGYFPTMSARLIHPPSLQVGDLNPGRMMDHDYISMLCAIAIFGVMAVVAALVFGFRFHATLLSRSLAARMESLLKPVDWVWILVGGVLLPMTIFYAIMIFTPVGGRIENLRNFSSWHTFDLEISQIVGLSAFLVVMPLLLARWRVKKRLTCIDFRRRSVLGWLALFCLMLVMALLPLNPPEGAMFVILTWPALWLLVVMFRSFFSPVTSLLPRLLMSRVLTVSYLCGMLALSLPVFGFSISMRYWFEHEKFMKIDPEIPEIPSFNYRVLEVHRSEMKAFLGR